RFEADLEPRSVKRTPGFIGSASTVSRMTTSHSCPWKRWTVLHSIHDARSGLFLTMDRISRACSTYGVMIATDSAPALTDRSARSEQMAAFSALARDCPPACSHVVLPAVSTTTNAAPAYGSIAAILVCPSRFPPCRTRPE